MEHINELTGKAADGTTQTARSVERLTEMSEDMRKSVAGFKLPEDMASAA
jgi:twitching motility protein PilJ